MKFIQLVAFSTFCTFAAMTQASNELVERYKDPSSIPVVLSANLKSGAFLEGYVTQFLQKIRRNSADNVSLKHSDIERAVYRAIRRSRASRLRLLTELDENLDGGIEKAEVEAILTKQNPSDSRAHQQRKARNLKDVMAMDLNGDGVITVKELTTLPKKEVQDISDSLRFKQLKALLALDPNKDKVLMVDELQRLAHKAFATIDIDNDQHISGEEFKRYEEIKMQMYHSKVTYNGCKLPKYDDTEDLLIYAAGAHNGGRDVNIAVDHSGKSAHQVDVVVNQTERPVALMLGAYGPTIWNIQHTPNTEIKAVFVTGIHGQFVMGLDKKTPMLVSSGELKSGCGRHYFYEERLQGLNPLAKHLFKKEVDLFFPIGAKADRVVVGKPLDDNAKLIRNDDLRVESFRLKNALQVGQPGIDEAVRKGLIRKATKAEIELVYDAHVERIMNEKAGRIPPVAGMTEREAARNKLNFLSSTLTVGRVYVVLKAFEYPADLRKTDADVFIVLKGAPQPTGESGFSYVFDLNTSKCLSRRCLLKFTKGR